MMDKTKQPPRAAKRCCRATLLAAAAFACCCGSYAAAQEAASAAPSTTTQPRDEAPLSAPLQVVQDAISAGTADVSANASADADVAMPLAEVAPPCSAPGACGAELRLAGGMGMARAQARAESEAAATTRAAAAEAAAAQTTGMVPSALRGSASVGQQARPRAARRPPDAATR
ncbi:hypothetical protein A7U59_11660 [Burkholderia pseudomallei]|nr:hypothetical protein A7U59_11660 [Burkholderia pseudomallei]